MSCCLTHKMKRGDLEPAIPSTLSTELDGVITPIDLTACTVKFIMKSRTAVVISAAAVIVDAVNGKVRYDWIAGDTNIAGTYFAEWEITKPGSRPMTAPGEGFITVYINPDLG